MPAASHSLPASPPPLVLASTSPRRSELLQKLGLPFDVTRPRTGEITSEDPARAEETAVANALLKARSIAGPDRWTIGADTVVATEEKILGKPVDLAEARSMLRHLSNRVHRVITGVALVGPGALSPQTFHVTTVVAFNDLDDDAIGHYLDLIDPLDKAGGYAAQDHGHLIIRRVEGPLDNVIGLPLDALADHLNRIGYRVRQQDAPLPTA